MKKIIILSTALIVSLALSIVLVPITSHASSYAEEWLKKKQQQQEKYMDELEKDGNLTQEAIDSISKGTSNRKPNHKSTRSSINSNNSSGSSSGSSSYSGAGKGWVYSTDELHVIGLPEGENGYTKPGWYGDID